MKGKDSALSRDRNLAKIKLLCNDSGHRDVRLDEKKQTHRRLVNILFVHMSKHVDNFGDFAESVPSSLLD